MFEFVKLIKPTRKMMVMTTSGSKPMMVEAIYTKGRLTMADPEELPSDIDAMENIALPRLAKLSHQGWNVIIDEISGDITRATNGSHIRLDGITNAGEPIVARAMDLYTEMSARMALSLPAKNPGLYEIPRSMVNVQYSTKGEKQYIIDWQNLRTEQRLTLLAVYSATTDLNLLGMFRSYLSSFASQDKPTAAGELARGISIMNQIDQKAASSADNGMAGKRIDDNSWYL